MSPKEYSVDWVIEPWTEACPIPSSQSLDFASGFKYMQNRFLSAYKDTTKSSPTSLYTSSWQTFKNEEEAIRSKVDVAIMASLVEVLPEKTVKELASKIRLALIVHKARDQLIAGAHSASQCHGYNGSTFKTIPTDLDTFLKSVVGDPTNDIWPVVFDAQLVTKVRELLEQ